jgi:putative ABC transport system permease protein
VAVQSGAECWSKADGYGLAAPGIGGAGPGFYVDWVIPVLIAAVDPVAEAELDGLDHAVISGKYLTEVGGDEAGTGTFPVLASSSSAMDEYALTQLQALAPPGTPPDMTVGWMEKQATAPGRTLVTAAAAVTSTHALRRLPAAHLLAEE